MTGSVRKMSTGQAKDLSIVLAQAGLTDLTFEQAKRLLRGEGKKRLMSGVKALQMEISGSQVSHMDICIRCIITDKEGVRHRFEAVGFLEDDEIEVTLEEVCRRLGKRMITSDEDWVLVSENQDQHHRELLNFAYLLTARAEPDRAGFVSYLGRSGRGWNKGWHDLEGHFNKSCLVLCRVA